MRIISSFADYYDGVQSYGQDLSVVYQRKTVEYGPETVPPVVKELIEKVSEVRTIARHTTHLKRAWFESGYGLPSVLRNKKASYNIYHGIIVFCGKLYPYLQLKYQVPPEVATTYFFYNATSMLDFCDEHRLIVDEKTGWWDKMNVRSKIEKYFEASSVSINWLIENKVICATIEKNKVTLNPRLRDFQFFKAVDAYTAYQELDSWICGTLAYPQNVMVELDDKSLIAKHGFNKWSFRKQPEGYKG